MLIKDWLDTEGRHACEDAQDWLRTLGESATMAEAWAQCTWSDWMFWALDKSDALPDDRTLRKLACAFVRRTPLADGRTVWDLLTDERSRNAVKVAERYADGNATDAELAAARDAATAAWYAAMAASSADSSAANAAGAAWDAASAARDAWDVTNAANAAGAAARAACAAAGAAWAAAGAAALTAQCEIIREFMPCPW
jgi:hypothetical protein